jgi:hypothetical protein
MLDLGSIVNRCLLASVVGDGDRYSLVIILAYARAILVTRFRPTLGY